jgi:hypothetical protein
VNRLFPVIWILTFSFSRSKSSGLKFNQKSTDASCGQESFIVFVFGRVNFALTRIGIVKAFGCKTGADVGHVDFASALDSESWVGFFSLRTVVFVLADFSCIEVF